MKNIITFLLLILSLLSCTSTKYIDRPVPVETIKTEYINQIYRDTVIERDSIDRFIRGDTLVIYKYKYRYKYLNRTDTVCKTDTIPKIVKVDVVKEVEVNHIHWYQRALMWAGGIATILLAGGIIYKLKF